MALRINSHNKDSIEKVHLLTGEDKDTVKRFFESLAFLFTTDYLDKEWTNIPFFGDMRINHTGDEFVKGGKRVKLTLEFEPEENLLRNIGQIEDGEQSEVEETFMNRLRNALDNYTK